MPDIDKDSFNALFKSEPSEIVEYFSSKGLRPSFNWYEVYEQAHATAFTVAKMTEIDLLKDTKKLLENAIKEGTSYSTFKKEAQSLFERKGWIGYKEMKDPKTGEVKLVELGTPSRIKKIYDCNMASAYAVGRYKEQLEEIDVAPYFQYIAIMDNKTRPEHRALHLKVFRADDMFWTMFYPPNGWGCRCIVRNLTENEVKQSKLKVEDTKGKISYVKSSVGDKEIEMPTYKFNNKGTMMTLTPDKGWGVNLGVKAWGIDIQAWNKVENMPDSIKYDFISKMASNPYRKKDYLNWANNIFNNGLKNTELEKVISWLSVSLYKKINVNSKGIDSPIIVISNSQIGHSGINKNLKQALSKNEYLKVYDIINNPDEVYYDYTKPKWLQIAFIHKIANSNKCIKVCVRFNQKSKLKDRTYKISKVTTVAKVPYIDIKKGDKYKKIE